MKIVNIMIILTLLMLVGCTSDDIIQEVTKTEDTNMTIEEGVGADVNGEEVTPQVNLEPQCRSTEINKEEVISYPSLEKVEKEKTEYDDHKLSFEILEGKEIPYKKEKYYTFFDNFKEVYANINMIGWDENNVAVFTVPDESVLEDSFEITNTDEYTGDFLIERIFPTEKGSEYFLGDKDNVKSVEIEPGKTETVTFKNGIICYKYKDITSEFSGNTLPSLIEFQKKYGLDNEDAIIFPSKDHLWACVSARYHVIPPVEKIPRTVTTTELGLVNRNKTRTVTTMGEVCE